MCFCLRYVNRLITHLWSGNRFYIFWVMHKLFCGPPMLLDAPKTLLYARRHMQTRWSDVVHCELLLWGFEGGLSEELELCCGFTHMSLLWHLLMAGSPPKPHWRSIPTLVSACSYACCVSVSQMALFTFGGKKKKMYSTKDFSYSSKAKGSTSVSLRKNQYTTASRGSFQSVNPLILPLT